MELSPVAQQWVNLMLIWIGFGTVVGLLAKSLLPGHEPAGTVGTLLIGIAGSVVGPLVLTLTLKRDNFNPISPVGFLVAIAGASVLLLLYRVCITCFTVRQE
ncbi:MAG: GlsB/YeaQ/YmgE family stress response membrane protein [Thermoguttaceae bacterium]|jgi:uncharacterized membrane protein YeaQ/YmgE (transglycosylase-associated protein family)